MSVRSIVFALSLALAGLAAPLAASAMTFERVEAEPICKTDPCVLATGEIDADTAHAFTAFIKARKIGPGATVVFDSPGGALLASLEFGQAIRSAGLFTAVGRYDAATHSIVRGGQCVSACAYAFLGGVQRGVDPNARIGVHQFSCAADTPDGLNVSDAQMLMALISIYMNKMVGRTGVLTLAAATPPANTRWLSAQELRVYGVVTD